MDKKLSGFQSISDKITGEMPDVQPHAIEAERQDQENRDRELNDLRDTKGNRFDPNVHETLEDGSPRLSKNGLLIRKRGRGAASYKASGKQDTPDNATRQAASIWDYRQAGRTAAHSMFAVSQLLGGEEWRPIIDEKLGVNEPQNLEDAFAAYFEAKGIVDIPPGWGLVIAIVGYSAPRFYMPKTQSRMQRLKEKLIITWYNWRNKGKPKKEPENVGEKQDVKKGK